MRAFHLLTLLPFLAASASLSAQIQATYDPFGNGCAGTGTGLGAKHVAPAAYANTFGSSNNVYGFSYDPSRYQQVIVGTEFPTAFTMAAIAARWDNQNTVQIPEALVDVEIRIGYTSKTPASLSTTFDQNWDLGTPVTVLPRTLVRYPAQNNPPATDPTQFQLVIPFTTNFDWVPQAGRNLLVEIFARANSTGVPHYTYVVDACYSTSIGRVFGSPDTATTGMHDANYALPLAFLELTHTAVPVLSNSDFPQIGNQFLVNVSQARPSAPGFLFFGLSRTNWSGIALPFAMDPIGAPTCSLLTSIDVATPLTTNSSGKRSITYDVPLSLSMVGARFYNQFLISDPTVNPLGFVTSNGGAGVIGN